MIPLAGHSRGLSNGGSHSFPCLHFPVLLWAPQASSSGFPSSLLFSPNYPCLLKSGNCDFNHFGSVLLCLGEFLHAKLEAAKLEAEEVQAVVLLAENPSVIYQFSIIINSNKKIDKITFGIYDVTMVFGIGGGGLEKSIGIFGIIALVTGTLDPCSSLFAVSV